MFQICVYDRIISTYENIVSATVTDKLKSNSCFIWAEVKYLRTIKIKPVSSSEPLKSSSQSDFLRQPGLYQRVDNKK